MTRMEKYAKLRAKIEFDNLKYAMEHIEEFMYFKTHQADIKKELGCKH